MEAFLSGAPEPEPQQAPPATPEPKAPEPPKEPPEPPAVEPDDEGDPPEPSPGEPVVPRRALEDERHKRQNYVAQAAKFEAERDMLAKQLEELKRAPAQPPQPQAPAAVQPIDPAQDPQGYHARIQGVLLNERLNMSRNDADQGDGRGEGRGRSRRVQAARRRTIHGCIRSCINRPIRLAGWPARSSGCG